jgi:DNA-binding MarR family transcriptional regulator
MIKSLLPEVAKHVGKSSALLLNQLALLFKSLGNRNNKIYRTNKELVLDLEGILSESTIKRCKTKLVEDGYIIITFDKGLKRQTYFSLTEKAINILENFIPDLRKYITPVEKTEVKKTDGKSTEDVKTKDESNKKLVKKEKFTPSTPNAGTKQMIEAFDEGFTNKQAIDSHQIKVKSFSDLIKLKQTKQTEVNDKSNSFKEKLMSLNTKKEETADYSLDSELDELRDYYGNY